MSRVVQLSQVAIDGGTQPRCEIDESLVTEYAEAMRDGAQFPPIVVFHDGVKFWLADGFHRTHAARKAGLEVLDADVRDGTRRDAILFSVGANAAHGSRRTNADKRKAVMTLLEDEEWSQWSDREIARQCAVHHTFVGKMRGSLVTNTSDDTPPRTYTTKHGTTAKMNTANIGKRADPDDRVEVPAPPAAESPKPIASRGRGLELAHEAIQVLHKIPHNDGLRQDAFDTVIEWITANR